eukprot:scaffold1046_cov172-Amphora_coffeaeformis.AAC.15
MQRRVVASPRSPRQFCVCSFTIVERLAVTYVLIHSKRTDYDTEGEYLIIRPLALLSQIYFSDLAS